MCVAGDPGGPAPALHYAGWGRTSEPVVEPLGLVLKAGRWYLLAAKRGEERIYRLDSVLEAEAEATGERFDRPRDYDLARAWGRRVERFDASLRRGTATLRVRPSALDRLDRLGADMAEPLLAAEPGADGRRTADVPIEGVAHAAGLLLGFGDEVEVLAPAELRDELARRAARVTALYRSADATLSPDDEHTTAPGGGGQGTIVH